MYRPMSLDNGGGNSKASCNRELETCKEGKLERRPRMSAPGQTCAITSWLRRSSESLGCDFHCHIPLTSLLYNCVKANLINIGCHGATQFCMEESLAAERRTFVAPA